jgi:hypothetical protein
MQINHCTQRQFGAAISVDLSRQSSVAMLMVHYFPVNGRKRTGLGRCLGLDERLGYAEQPHLIELFVSWMWN